MGRVSYLLTLLLLSGCGGGNKGVVFDLSPVDNSWPQYQTLVNASATINTIVKHPCLKYNLNDLPREYEDLRDIDTEVMVGIYNVLPDDAAANHGGGKISLTWPCFSSESYLIGVLFHELAHNLGYNHPKYGEPGYYNSFPERANRAAQQCLRTIRQASINQQ